MNKLEKAIRFLEDLYPKRKDPFDQFIWLLFRWALVINFVYLSVNDQPDFYLYPNEPVTFLVLLWIAVVYYFCWCGHDVYRWIKPRK
jgi:hypothetical protein